MHRISQQVNQPHALRRAEERLQERLRPRPVPPQHRHDLAHLPVAEPAELLAEVPRPLAQHLLPRQPPQPAERREVRLGSGYRVKDLGHRGLAKSDRLEVVEEGPVQQGLEVEGDGPGVFGERELDFVGLEEEREPVVDLGARVAQLES